MTRTTKAAAKVVPADINVDAYYSVVLVDRAVLPHETLPAREEPYEMRGRFLVAIIDKVGSYTEIA